MVSMLNIPILPDPTRQKIWRVVFVAGTILAAWMCVVGSGRIIRGFSDAVAPTDITSLRITKDRETLDHLQSLTGGLNVIPSVPFSLPTLLRMTDRALNVWFRDDGTVTVVIDRTVDDRTATSLMAFGATVVRDESSTVVTNAPTVPSVDQRFFSGLWSSLFLGADGVLSHGDAQLTFDVTSTTATLHGAGLLDAPNIDEANTDATAFSASVSGASIASLTSRAFTQNTPGFASLMTLASANGISAHIDQVSGDASATAKYTIAIPLTDETQSFANETALTALAKELVEVPTIEGVVGFLDDGGRTLTLRSREVASVAVRDDAPYRFITATTSRGSVSITQTPTLLTVSNHDQAGSGTVVWSNTCLSNATAFVRPTMLFSLLASATHYRSTTLGDLLWSASTIASSSSTTRICFDE